MIDLRLSAAALAAAVVLTGMSFAASPQNRRDHSRCVSLKKCSRDAFKSRDEFFEAPKVDCVQIGRLRQRRGSPPMPQILRSRTPSGERTLPTC